MSRRVLHCRVLEAFDEGERRIARISLCLEPAAIEQLAFKRGEEALAHDIVVCVSDRALRGMLACLATTMTELNRGVLRTLVGVIDHAAWLPTTIQGRGSVRQQHRTIG